MFCGVVVIVVIVAVAVVVAVLLLHLLLAADVSGHTRVVRTCCPVYPGTVQLAIDTG